MALKFTTPQKVPDVFSCPGGVDFQEAGFGELLFGLDGRHTALMASFELGQEMPPDRSYVRH